MFEWQQHRWNRNPFHFHCKLLFASENHHFSTSSVFGNRRMSSHFRAFSTAAGMGRMSVGFVKFLLTYTRKSFYIVFCGAERVGRRGRFTEIVSMGNPRLG